MALSFTVCLEAVHYVYGHGMISIVCRRTAIKRSNK